MSRGMVHDLVILRRDHVTRDAEGRGTVVHGEYPLRGRIESRGTAMPGESPEHFLWSAVAIVPLDQLSRLAEADAIRASGTGVLGLDGVWDIEAYTPTRAHIRVTLQRAQQQATVAS